jgi:hypothetical protein
LLLLLVVLVLGGVLSLLLLLVLLLLFLLLLMPRRPPRNEGETFCFPTTRGKDAINAHIIKTSVRPSMHPSVYPSARPSPYPSPYLCAHRAELFDRKNPPHNNKKERPSFCTIERTTKIGFTSGLSH